MNELTGLNRISSEEDLTYCGWFQYYKVHVFLEELHVIELPDLARS